MEKSPIGLNELSSTAQIPFVDRSEVSDRFSAAEELGVHLESLWPEWLLQLSVTNGGRRLLLDNNKSKDVTARVVWAPLHWLSLGTAMLQGKAGSESSEHDRYNLELKVGSNLSGFQSEFYRARDGGILSSAFYFAGHWAFPANGTSYCQMLCMEASGGDLILPDSVNEFHISDDFTQAAVAL